MRILLLFSLLACLSTGQNAGSTQEGSLVVVLDFKYLKSSQTVKKMNPQTTTPAADMSTAIKNDRRYQRPHGEVGARDPNTETIDGRSAALEKNVQEAQSPKSTPLDGYLYQAKIRNAHTQNIEVVFWEYQFKELANPTNVVRRQFLCSVKVKPDKERELQAFSLLGPSDVITVDSLIQKSRNPFEEKAVINRVEYADGSILQRQDWNFAEVKSSIERAIKAPWGSSEMCRSL